LFYISRYLIVIELKAVYRRHATNRNTSSASIFPQAKKVVYFSRNATEMVCGSLGDRRDKYFLGDRLGDTGWTDVLTI